jgi:hypothetical protein
MEFLCWDETGENSDDVDFGDVGANIARLGDLEDSRRWLLR